MSTYSRDVRVRVIEQPSQLSGESGDVALLRGVVERGPPDLALVPRLELRHLCAESETQDGEVKMRLLSSRDHFLTVAAARRVKYYPIKLYPH